MAYKEIVTKAVIGKGKKKYHNTYQISTEQTPTTILGCWIINHNFSAHESDGKILINGSFDANIWYSYDNDTKTEVVTKTDSYVETVHLRDREDIEGEEIIVRSLKQPNCVKVDIAGDKITYVVEKELGIELVGDIKVKIEANTDEIPWEEIEEEPKVNEIIDKVDEEVKEDFIEEKVL